MYQPFLKGKVAIVTGGIGSIGEAICVELAKAGADVAVNGRRDAAPADAMKAIAAPGTRTMYVKADMRKRAEMEAMVNHVLKEWGHIDILVNCAGVQHVAPVDELSPEFWNEIIDVNLSSVFHMTSLVIPAMKKQNWGRIVNISSVLGLVGNQNKGAYTASKHGVNGLTKCTALELATTPITCNAICPGYVDTPLLRKEIMALADEKFGGDFDKAVYQTMIEKQPSLKFVSCEAVGQCVVFLCSPAADEMRGSTITPDGATATG